ncbi:plasmid stabilization protein [Rothia sp. P7181]|uniref:plasmid stabilization protein n=1 Tax=unclassified Rothia (in: high G+C Gram-positive bacteria) TaxID=2689056 RepID=UPI003AD14E1D
MSIRGLLLDSDVLAEIRKATPHPQVVAFLRRRSYMVMYISALSLGELKGLYPYPETERWVNELLERFSGQVLDVDTNVSLAWAGRQIRAEERPSPEGPYTPLPTAALEGLMAATAEVHQLEIVSSKADIYRRWGVPAVNPLHENAARGL